MRRGLLAIGALALVAAVLAAPRPKRASAGDPAVDALRIALGPLCGPVADALRLRASFARSEGNAMESVRLQEMALELSPDDTTAALLLANEIAFDLPAANATAASRKEYGRLGAAVLDRARALGNRAPELLDAEAFLLSERVAPRDGSTPSERVAALDRAVELAESAADRWILAHARAAALLTERGAARYALGRARDAADDFERAALHDRLLEQRGDRSAAPLIRANEIRGRIAEIDAGERAGETRDASLRELESLAPDDPFLAEARRRR